MPATQSNDITTNFTQNTIEVAIRLGLLLLLGAWCFQIISPFTEPVMGGVIIAVAIFPLFVKLKYVMGGRNRMRVFLITMAAIYIVNALTVFDRFWPAGYADPALKNSEARWPEIVDQSPLPFHVRVRLWNEAISYRVTQRCKRPPRCRSR